MENEEINIIEKTCEELGINQTELAKEIGVSRTTISDWNTGKTKISKVAKNLLDLKVKYKKCEESKKNIFNKIEEKFQLS